MNTFANHFCSVGPDCTLAIEAAWLAWLPAVAMIGGILVLGSSMMVFFSRRERQMRALAGQIGHDLDEARALRQQLDEAHALASNMMVSAQRLSARLDERVAVLDMASLRMSATRNALPRNTAAPSPAPAHLRQRGVESEDTPAPNDLALSPVLCSIASAMAPAPARRADAHAAVAQSSRASYELKPTLDPFTQQVYELADAGRPSVSIARDLNEQVGKIDLILALRSR